MNREIMPCSITDGPQPDDLEFEEPRIPYASAEDSKRFLPIERERDARTRHEGQQRQADALEIEASRILRTLNQAN